MLRKFIILLPGLLLLLMGGASCTGAFTFGVKYIEAEERARLQWPTAQGTVLASSIGKVRGSDYDDLIVDFGYQVGGVSYVGKQKWPVGRGTLHEYSLANYWQGKTVPVYYNPANPAEGLVAPKLADPVWAVYAILLSSILGLILSILGLILLGLGIWVLVENFRTNRDESRASITTGGGGW